MGLRTFRWNALYGTRWSCRETKEIESSLKWR